MVAIAAALAGCKSEKGTKLPNSTDLPERSGAEMWRHAPAGAQGGIVLAPGAGADIHGGLIAVAEGLRRQPGGAALRARLTAGVGVDPTARDGLDAIGIDPSKGAGLFVMPGGGLYAILPVSDRTKFREAIGGEEREGVDRIGGAMHCAPSGPLYRCAPSVDKLDAWQPASPPIDAGWPDELRGSIEVLATGELLAFAGPLAAAIRPVTALRGSVSIERGGFLARFSLEGRPTRLLAVGQAPLAAAVMGRKPSAVIVGHGRPLLERIKAQMAGRLDVAGPGGITPAEVIDALTGEVAAYSPSGRPSRGYVEIGIHDSAPFKKLRMLCGVAPPLPGVSFKQTRDGCELTFDPPDYPEPIVIPIRIGDRSIIASFGDRSASREGKVGSLPPYLTGHRWLGAMWLHGSMLSSAEEALPIPSRQLQQAVAGNPELVLGLWTFAHLSELGAGLRTDAGGIHGFFRLSTTWRNPPAVVAELEPLLDRVARGELDAVGNVKALAAKHPGSPLATDLELGSGGGAAGAAIVGILAAVAVPAFVKYIKKSKTSEARQNVKRLYDRARDYYLDAPAGAARHFAKTSTPITPPLGTCCAQGGQCAPNPEWWNHQTWRELTFSIDRPHYYSYQYEVAPDGSRFTARAIGDLDCDGEYSTFEMRAGIQPEDDSGLERNNELE